MILDLNYKKIQYLTDPETSKNIGVNITVDDKTQVQVSLNTENKYYAEIKRQVDAGELTIEDAD